MPSVIHIRVANGMQPDGSDELEYEGSAPLVLGLGHAVVRDTIAYLKSGSADNPLCTRDVERRRPTRGGGRRPAAASATSSIEVSTPITAVSAFSTASSRTSPAPVE